MEPKQLSDSDLQSELSSLRAEKDRVQARLRALVAESDRRATLADMEKRYGKEQVAAILSPPGIPSSAKVGVPGS